MDTPKYKREMDKNVALSYYEENTRDHRTRYVADVTHLRYGEHKIIKDYDYSIVRHKVDDLIKKWQSRDELAEGAESARLQTLEIRELNQNIENILIDGLFQCNDVFGYYRQKLDSQLLKLKEAINEVKVLQRKLKRPTLPVLVTKQYPDEPIFANGVQLRDMQVMARSLSTL